MAPPVEASTSAQRDAEALFPEARQRARRRRLLAAGVVALLAAGTATGLAAAGGDGVVALPLAGPRFARAVIAASRSAGSLDIDFTYRDTTGGGCIPPTNTSTTTGTAAFDLRSGSTEVTEHIRGCQIPPYAMRWRVEGGHAFLQINGSVPGESLGWHENSEAAYVRQGSGFLDTALTLSSPIGALGSITGRMIPAGSTTLGGLHLRLYRTSVTLATLDRALLPAYARPSVLRFPHAHRTARLVPPARDITASLTVGVDDRGRLRHLVMRQPLYTGVYTDGSDQEQAQQIPSLSEEGGGEAMRFPNGKVVSAAPLHFVALRRLRRQSTSTLPPERSASSSA